MTKIDLLVHRLWAVSCGLEGAALLSSISHRKTSRPLLVYLAVHFVWNGSLLLIPRVEYPALYFYLYWYGRLAIFFLECWTLAHLLEPVLQASHFLSKELRRAIAIIALAASIVAWYCALSVPSTYPMWVTRFVFAAERGLVTTEALALVGILALGSAMALRWNRFTITALAGFALGMLESMATAAILPVASPLFRDAVRIGIQVVDCFIFGLWILAFSLTPNPRSKEQADDVSADANNSVLEVIPT